MTDEIREVVVEPADQPPHNWPMNFLLLGIIAAQSCFLAWVVMDFPGMEWETPQATLPPGMERIVDNSGLEVPSTETGVEFMFYLIKVDGEEWVCFTTPEKTGIAKVKITKNKTDADNP
tara:strand:+ start:737 stop:1093 length:357 start_codon:yes stop_codon:yes gene_type:complete